MSSANTSTMTILKKKNVFPQTFHGYAVWKSDLTLHWTSYA